MKSDNGAISAVSDALALGAAKVDTAYAGLTSVGDILSSFQSKLVAASEPGVDKSKVQEELEQYKQQVLSIANSASFSGENWLTTDFSDIWQPAETTTSVVSSFSRSGDNNVRLGRIDMNLHGISLFNTTGGGLLQTSTKTTATTIPGGTVSDIGGLLSGVASDTPHFGHSWFYFDNADVVGLNDTIEFDLMVDQNGSYSAGAGYHIVIDQALVNTALGKLDGSIANKDEMVTVLNAALDAAGAPADSVSGYHYSAPSGQLIDIFSNETVAPGAGSSIVVSGLSSSLSGGHAFGLEDSISTHNNIITSAYFSFVSGFELGATSNFSFDVAFPNVGTTASFSVSKADVDAALGTTDGIVGSADDLVTVLNSLGTGLTFSSSGTSVIVQPDPAVSPHVGRAAVFEISNGSVTDILTVPTTNVDTTVNGFDFLAIDITKDDYSIDQYISFVDKMNQDVISAAARVGSMQKRIDMQSTFTSNLKQTVEKGVGRLVDADMNEASTRLKALQTQQQLAVQALSIANSNASNIMTLFQ